MKIMKLILCAVMAAAITFGAIGVAESASVFEVEDAVMKTAIAALGDSDYSDLSHAVRLGDKAGLYCGKYIAVPMQKLLGVLGKRVNADGKAGERTIAALKEVQEALGLPVQDFMDVECMDHMFLCAYCLKDPEGAKAVLGESAEALIEAYALKASGRNYTARLKFESVAGEYGEAAELAANCATTMPEDGEIARGVDGKSMTLTITVESAEPGKAIVFRIINDKGNTASELFLNGEGSVTTQLPGGTYSIHMGTGEEWYGAQDVFGDVETARYAAVRFAGDRDTEMLRKGVNYTLYVNTEDNAEAPAMADIEWSEF